MKWILYIFLAANLLTFAWFSLHPELRSVSREPPAHVATPKGVNMIRLLNEHDPVTAVAAGTPLRPEAAGMCQSIGPFRDHEMADNALAVIDELGGEGTVRSATQKVKTGYWVYLDSMREQEVERIIDELKKKGIKDYHKTGRNELSLGIYNGLRSAERRRKRIAALGYAPILGPLYRNQTRYWVDVAEMKTRLLADDTWDSLLSAFPGSQRQSTECDLVNT
jgi:hypothetical protein